MNEQLKNQWLPLLKEYGIKEEDYDKILRYVNMFMIDNSLYGTTAHDMKDHKQNIHNQMHNILPLSLLVLSKVDLSRIEFINYPMGMETIILKSKSEYSISDAVSNFINMKLEEGFDIRIYKVIQSIVDLDVTCRMKFHKPGEPEPNYINNIDGKIFPTEDDTYFK
jgi:hypothetical protein